MDCTFYFTFERTSGNKSVCHNFSKKFGKSSAFQILQYDFDK